MLNPAQQARHLQGMANMTMGAFAQENRSRVSQAREARRQAHERELARIRNERDSSEMEMLLARLAAEKEMAEQKMRMEYMAKTGEKPKRKWQSGKGYYYEWPWEQ